MIDFCFLSPVATALPTTYPHSQTRALWNSRHLQMTTRYPNSEDPWHLKVSTTQRPNSLCASSSVSLSQFFMFPDRPGALEVNQGLTISDLPYQTSEPVKHLIMYVFIECINQQSELCLSYYLVTFIKRN